MPLSDNPLHSYVLKTRHGQPIERAFLSHLGSAAPLCMAMFVIGLVTWISK